MLVAIIIYVSLLVIVGLVDFFKIKDFKDFAVAGKKQTFIKVFLSLMATMIGASATIGIVERVVNIGFAAFWWLGVGGVGLFLQAFFLSEKIRSMDANTLPEVASKTVGDGARKMLAVIIAVSWIGIIGAQFVSIEKIISVMLPDFGRNSILIVVSIIVVAYTIIGGQMSVIRTDNIQALLIVLGTMITFVYLYFSDSSGNKDIVDEIALINNNFGVKDLIKLLFITGGAYFLGPDIVSRNFVSKDGKTAKKAAIASSFALIIFGLIITLIGMWIVENVAPEKTSEQNPLVYIMSEYLPYPVAVLLCLGLVSALVSSADTCLVNAATIVEQDILKRDKVNEVRIIICILGFWGLFLAVFNSDIIDLLMGAYSIYVPGIVCPLLVGILSYGKHDIRMSIWYMAVLIGGGLGFVGTYFNVGDDCLPVVGMGASLLLSVLSVKHDNITRNSKDIFQN